MSKYVKALQVKTIARQKKLSLQNQIDLAKLTFRTKLTHFRLIFFLHENEEKKSKEGKERERKRK